MGTLLAAIERQADVRFGFSRDVVPVDRPVKLRADSITVAAALVAILMDTNLDVVLSSGGKIALVSRGGTRVSGGPAGSLTGRITEAGTDHPVVGADVFLEGTRHRTASDSLGRYRLTEVDPGSYTLAVRRLGYTKQSRQITVSSEREDTVNVALAPAAVPLNELVTTATGRQRRRDIGNLVTTIDADSVLQHAPIKNLTDMLENRVPGLHVQHTSGAPGDPSRLRLRGLNSVLRSNDPVVVVDNVRVYAAQSEARSGNLTNALGGNPLPAPSPLDQIDPNTIEKVEVLSGASAATLYGADAANGVIVITTKKGRPGPTRWTASFTQGRETSPGTYPTGYYRWGHDLFTYNPRFCTIVDISCRPDSLVTFQALNEPSLTLLGRGRRTALSLTASGGNQALTYSVTGSYNDALGLLTLPGYEVDRFRTQFGHEAPDWMQRPHHYEDWSVASNVTARLGSTADLTLTTSLSRSEQQRTGLEAQVQYMSGTLVDTLRGLYYRPSNNHGLVLESSPTILQDYYTHVTAQTITFTTGLNATWRPRSWFNGSAQAGLNVVPRNDVSLRSSFTRDSTGTVSRGTGHSLVSSFNLQGALRKPLGRGFNFETNVGANVSTTSTEDLLNGATGLAPGTSTAAGARFVSVADASSAQSSYGWYVEPRVSGQRLSLSAGLRLDGGSANGARLTGTGARSGNLFSLRNLLALPRLNGSWVISEEPWFPFPSLFSSLRLRGAFGHAQVQPGPADRLRLYNTKVELTTLGNTQIRPERSSEVEGGFDADLFNSRVSVELTGYRKLQVDALMNVELPGSIKGGASIVKNIGNVLNRGLALTLGVTPVQQQRVTWSTKLYLSYSHNELTKLGRGVDRNYDAGLVEGYPVGSRWAKPIVGFLDLNGDGALQPNEIQIGDSAVFVGRLLPAYQGTLNTNLALFGRVVGITADFAFDGGQSQIDNTAASNWVLSRPLVDPSAPQGQQAAVIAYVTNYQGGKSGAGDNLGTPYGVIQRVSTFRFASFSVNYQAPQAVARLLRAEQIDLAVQGSNLGLHSTYRGMDPNVNAWRPGEGISDGGQLPQPRTWQLRVDLRY